MLYEGSATFVVAGLKLSGGEAGDGGIGFLEVQGFGGHIAVKTSPEVLDMKRCPMMVMRKSKIQVENVGNVSLDLKCTDSNLKDIGGAGRRYDAGSISVNPVFLSLLPKQSAALTVSVTMRTVGEAEFGLMLSLQNTQGKQQWPIKVLAVGDEIQHSVEMTKILESERLMTQPAEVSENKHLAKVLQPVDDIANVAVHHIRACVQPLTSYESIQRIREVPPALPKISVGDTRFRQCTCIPIFSLELSLLVLC